MLVTVDSVQALPATSVRSKPQNVFEVEPQPQSFWKFTCKVLPVNNKRYIQELGIFIAKFQTQKDDGLTFSCAVVPATIKLITMLHTKSVTAEWASGNNFHLLLNLAHTSNFYNLHQQCLIHMYFFFKLLISCQDIFLIIFVKFKINSVHQCILLTQLLSIDVTENLVFQWQLTVIFTKSSSIKLFLEITQIFMIMYATLEISFTFHKKRS